MNDTVDESLRLSPSNATDLASLAETDVTTTSAIRNPKSVLVAIPLTYSKVLSGRRLASTAKPVINVEQQELEKYARKGEEVTDKSVDGVLETPCHPGTLRPADDPTSSLRSNDIVHVKAPGITPLHFTFAARAGTVE